MSAEAPIQLHFTYTFNDLVSQGRAPLHTPVPFGWHHIAGWITVAFGAYWIFRLFGSDPAAAGAAPPARGNSILPAATLVVCFAVIYVSRKITLRRARKKWEAATPIPVTLTLSLAGLIWEYNQTRVEQAWSAYRAAAESQNTFLIQPLKGPEVPIPKRVMTEQQIVVIRQLLQDAITSARGFPVETHAPQIPARMSPSSPATSPAPSTPSPPAKSPAASLPPSHEGSI